MNLKAELWMKYHLNFPIAGGNGDSYETAIKILLNNNLGILLEKDIIAHMFFEGNHDMKLISQELQIINNIKYDLLTIELPNGNKKTIYFDIDEFFGKSFRLFNRGSKEYNELLLSMTRRPDAEEEMSWFN